MGVHPEDVRAAHVGEGVEGRGGRGGGEGGRDGCREDREAKGENRDREAGGRAERIAQHSTAGRELGRVTRSRTGQGRQGKKQEEGRKDTEFPGGVSREAQPELGPGWKQMWWLWNLTGEGRVAQ